MNKQFVCAALLLTHLLFQSGCASKPELVDEEAVKQPSHKLIKPVMPPLPAGTSRLNGIAAVVNDDVITFREVIREAQPLINEAQKKGLVDDTARRELRVKILERLIDKTLTDQKVKELGIKIDEEEIRQAVDDVRRQNNNMTHSQLEAALKAQGFSMSQYEMQIREQLERMRLVSVEVRSKVHVSDREAAEFYETNKQKYAEEERFKARHIFIRINENAPAEQLRAAMVRALNLLHEAKSGKDFAELARQNSDDPAAKTDGGDLGTFKRGEMLSDLEQALLPLKAGEVGELVSTPSGLHIVKLDERSSGTFKPFEAVKKEIIETMYRKKQDERFAQWLKELRSKASIQVMDGTGII